MRRTFPLLALLGCTAWFGSASIAAAQGIVSEAAQEIAGTLSGILAPCTGPQCSISVAEFIVSRLQAIIGILGTFYIVRNGFTMVYATEETEQAEARKAIGSVAAGLLLCFLAPRLLLAFYTAGGEEGVASSEQAAAAGAAVLTEEITGILNWAEVLVAVASITVIIATGIRSLAGFGKEENLTNMKSTVMRIASGILIILMTEAVKASLGVTDNAPPGSPDASIILTRGFQIVSQILALSTLVAVAVIVYAAIMMIIAFGKEEQITKSKSLILYASIGLIVILISWMAINFVLQVVG